MQLIPIRTPCTLVILFLCIFFFLLNAQEAASLQTSLTAVESWLLFDIPSFSKGHFAFWQGISSWLFLKVTTGSGALAEGPLFMKIREGEVWRLFSPALLHRDFLHILFNMLWLWMFSRPMEERMGSLKMIVFVLTVGVASNIAQYLMAGPLFLGYSGVVMGMAGFIWSRIKMAPWEGYAIPLTTLYFLGLFVVAMTFLQGVSLFLKLFTSFQGGPHIANTAHIVGAVVGIALGRSSWFMRRPQ